MAAEQNVFTEKTLTPRDVRLPWLAGKVDALVGMRRPGKTWRRYQTIDERLARGIPKQSHLYPNFSGLAQACSAKVQPDWGHHLETAVYLQLRRLGRQVDYDRTASGREVDFVAVGPHGARELVQVSADISNRTTRRREIAGLLEAAAELDLPDGTIVTETDEGAWEEAGRKIEKTPAWRAAAMGHLTRGPHTE